MAVSGGKRMDRKMSNHADMGRAGAEGEGASDGAAPVAAVQNLVTFRLGSQFYALPVEPVVQVVAMVAFTPLPQVPEPVTGVINVHGEAVPVVDLRRHLGPAGQSLAGGQLDLDASIILAHVGGRMVGLIVDEVVDVLTLPSDRIDRPEDVLPEDMELPPVLRGLAHLAADLTPATSRLALVLEAEHLFLPHQQEALSRAAETYYQLLQERMDALARAEPAPDADTPSLAKRQAADVRSAEGDA